MQRTVLTVISLFAVLAYFALGCSDASKAQSVMGLSLTTNSSMAEKSETETEFVEELDYMVTTWSSPVTREEVKQYKSILDFWSDESKAKYKHDNFSEIWVVNLKDYPDWQLDVNEIAPEYKATGPTEVFTPEQLAIVANAHYSDHLRFSARFNSTKIETGEVEEYVLVSQSVSLVPDVQAAYKGGLEAVTAYLKESSKKHVAEVKRDKVGRCRIFFTVKDTGTISNVKLIETSNYADVDEALIKVVKNMPKKWKPAQDGSGNQVDQEFVFTFGQAGC